MAKRRFSELPRPVQVLIVALGAVQICLNIAAQIDISRRPAEQIRGPKAAWRLISLINFFGPVAYFRLGRRPVG